MTQFEKEIFRLVPYTFAVSWFFFLWRFGETVLDGTMFILLLFSFAGLLILGIKYVTES